MRILLEVINCILSLNLGRNPELVYALLHKQEVFEQLRPHAGFAELVENLKVRDAAGRQAGRDAAMWFTCCTLALRCCMATHDAHIDGTDCYTHSLGLLVASYNIYHMSGTHPWGGFI